MRIWAKKFASDFDDRCIDGAVGSVVSSVDDRLVSESRRAGVRAGRVVGARAGSSWWYHWGRGGKIYAHRG